MHRGPTAVISHIINVNRLSVFISIYLGQHYLRPSYYLTLSCTHTYAHVQHVQTLTHYSSQCVGVSSGVDKK